MMKDMKKLECNYCGVPRYFYSSNAFKDHMRNEHPFKKIQEINYLEKS